MDSSLYLSTTITTTTAELKIKEEEDPVTILGIDSVYNENSSWRTNLIQPDPPADVMLRCTAWRCKKCNEDFSTQAEIIRHVQQKLCNRKPEASLSRSTSLTSTSTQLPTTTTITAGWPDKPNQILNSPPRTRLDSKSVGTSEEEIRRAKLARDAARKRRRRLNETSEQRTARLKRNAEAKRRKHAAQTTEQREARLAKQAEYNRRHLQLYETPEQREARLAKHAEYNRLRRAAETEEQREARLSQVAEHQRRVRLKEISEEKQEKVRTKAAKRRQIARLNETEEEREARLDKMATNHRNRKNANISIEDRPSESAEMGAPSENATASIRRKRYKISLKPRERLSSLKQTEFSYTPRKCSICGKPVPLRYMKLHLVHHSEVEFEKTGIWTRPEDLNPTKTKIPQVPSSNLEDVGAPPPVFNCSTCNSCFSQEFLLTMHNRQAHDDDGDKKKSLRAKLQCSICSKIFKDLATLKKHTTKIHPPSHPPLHSQLKHNNDDDDDDIKL